MPVKKRYYVPAVLAATFAFAVLCNHAENQMSNDDDLFTLEELNQLSAENDQQDAEDFAEQEVAIDSIPQQQASFAIDLDNE